ncbi:MAG: radical SAM protein [Planctomycetes bacterium]|nr:radical SAM protein [Planctomycetota bacterium]
MKKDAALRPRTVVFDLTRRCPLKCAHCGTSGSPSRREVADSNKIIDWIRQISKVTKHLVFSGGEQFLEPELLRAAIESAHKNNLHVEVQTSGYWAKTREKGLKFLREFPLFKILAVSYDKFHEKFLSIEYVRNAVISGLERGTPRVIVRGVHAGYTRRSKQKNISFLKKTFSSLADRLNFVSIPLDIGGRAAVTDRSVLGYKQAGKLPSKNFCNAYESIFIDSSGAVYPCCKSLSSLPNKDDVVIGDLNSEELENIMKRAGYLFLPNMLRKSGPQALVKWMDRNKGRGFTRELRKNLPCNDVCGLCYRIFGDKKYVNTVGRMGSVMPPVQKNMIG